MKTNEIAFNFSIPANTLTAVNGAIKQIDGYTPVAIATVSLTQANVVRVATWGMDANKRLVSLGLMNTHSAAMSGTAFVTVLYARN